MPWRPAWAAVQGRPPPDRGGVVAPSAHWPEISAPPGASDRCWSWPRAVGQEGAPVSPRAARGFWRAGRSMERPAGFCTGRSIRRPVSVALAAPRPGGGWLAAIRRPAVRLRPARGARRPARPGLLYAAPRRGRTAPGWPPAPGRFWTGAAGTTSRPSSKPGCWAGASSRPARCRPQRRTAQGATCLLEPSLPGGAFWDRAPTPDHRPTALQSAPVRTARLTTSSRGVAPLCTCCARPLEWRRRQNDSSGIRLTGRSARGYAR